VARKRSRQSVIGDVTTRGLRARSCGARMYVEHLDWFTAVAERMDDPSAWLTDSELEAYQQSLPALWWVNWWRGWNDAAAAER
jgi:hypothetical protein